jgi:small subunit ribosomal protein S17
METIRKIRVGKVISNKMNKTVVVSVENLRRHPVYKKVVKRVKKFKVHDENSECSVGDVVKIRETRPLSKEKHWQLVEIIRGGEVAEVAPAEINEIDTEVK